MIERIAENIARYAKSDTTFFAKVLEVGDTTCKVSVLQDSAVELTGVLLRADTSSTNGFILKPAIGSIVLVTTINKQEQYAILMQSAVDSVIFQDGENGGLAIVPELKTQLDKTNEVVNAIVTALNNWIVAPNDGGQALKTLFQSLIAGKEVGDFSNIENPNFKH